MCKYVKIYFLSLARLGMRVFSFLFFFFVVAVGFGLSILRSLFANLPPKREKGKRKGKGKKREVSCMSDNTSIV